MAQQRPYLPEFGKWESEENVPYTLCFDKARKGRNAGKIINPSDPQEKPDMVHSVAPPTQAPSSKNRAMPEQPVGQGALRPKHERGVRKEESDLSQFSETLVSTGNMACRGRGSSGLPRHQHHGGRGPNYVQSMSQDTVSGHGTERSLLNPHSQTRTGERGSAHRSLEVNNSYGSGHERSRRKPVIRGDESPAGGVTVPKFGDWDEKNPSSGDNYTNVFKRLREDRHNGSRNGQGMDAVPSNSHSSVQRPNVNDTCKIRCIPWRRKKWGLWLCGKD